MVGKFVLLEDKVNAETKEVEFLKGETVLDVQHYMYSAAYDKTHYKRQRAMRRVWEPTPGPEGRSLVSSQTVIEGHVSTAPFTVGGRVICGAGGEALITVSREEHNSIVETRNDLVALVL